MTYRPCRTLMTITLSTELGFEWFKMLWKANSKIYNFYEYKDEIHLYELTKMPLKLVQMSKHKTSTQTKQQQHMLCTLNHTKSIPTLLYTQLHNPYLYIYTQHSACLTHTYMYQPLYQIICIHLTQSQYLQEFLNSCIYIYRHHKKLFQCTSPSAISTLTLPNHIYILHNYYTQTPLSQTHMHTQSAFPT